MNTAIIVAAGSGTRFNSDKPKQFIDVLGKPLIVHTLGRFQKAESVDSIVLVLADDRIREFESILQRFPIAKLSKVVSGGATRAESVRNGLSAVAPETSVVAVHDGARPLVLCEEIDATIKKASETGAACLVASVNDTIKTIRGGEIAATLDRTQLRRALTPQAFKIEVLAKAFVGAELSDVVTDECYLVEKLGHPIATVEGNARNIKITTREDLTFAEAILKGESIEDRATANK